MKKTIKGTSILIIVLSMLLAPLPVLGAGQVHRSCDKYTTTSIAVMVGDLIPVTKDKRGGMDMEIVRINYYASRGASASNKDGLVSWRFHEFDEIRGGSTTSYTRSSRESGVTKNDVRIRVCQVEGDVAILGFTPSDKFSRKQPVRAIYDFILEDGHFTRGKVGMARSDKMMDKKPTDKSDKMMDKKLIRYVPLPGTNPKVKFIRDVQVKGDRKDFAITSKLIAPSSLCDRMGYKGRKMCDRLRSSPRQQPLSYK